MPTPASALFFNHGILQDTLKDWTQNYTYKFCPTRAPRSQSSRWPFLFLTSPLDIERLARLGLRKTTKTDTLPRIKISSRMGGFDLCDRHMY